MEKIIFAWSGGKDSAAALYAIKKLGCYEALALLTTVTEGYDRISMHGVRMALLEEQARLLGLPLEKVFISKQSSNEEYEARMKDVLTLYKGKGVSSVAFGDIFLEDLKKYRQEKLALTGMEAIFPIWNQDTTKLAHDFIDLGFKAIITCVDSKFLDKSFTGRVFDKEFLADLPAGVDPCGENGEFHSFVYDGPIFRKKVSFEKGDAVLRENRFYYCDLLPLTKAPACLNYET